MSHTDKDAPRRLTVRHRWYDSPPAWYINHRWDARERMSARVACGEAAKEHRAGGDVETEPTTRQHRHCAEWDWT